MRSMLLIEGGNIFKLYNEILSIGRTFVLPIFLIATCLEFIGEMDFGAILKRVVIVFFLFGFFMDFHKEAVNKSFEISSELYSKYQLGEIIKKSRKDKKSLMDHLLIAPLADVLTMIYWGLSKVFIWLLKLIYSSVYHLTYVFAPFVALMGLLFGLSPIKGLFKSSLWCIVMPFVVVSILLLVGNTVNGSQLNSFSEIEKLIWLLGVTFILLISPLITGAIVRGDGIYTAGSKMGAIALKGGVMTFSWAPMAALAFKKKGDSVARYFKNLNPKRNNVQNQEKISPPRSINRTSKSELTKQIKTPIPPEKTKEIRGRESVKSPAFTLDRKEIKAPTGKSMPKHERRLVTTTEGQLKKMEFNLKEIYGSRKISKPNSSKELKSPKGPRSRK